MACNKKTETTVITQNSSTIAHAANLKVPFTDLDLKNGRYYYKDKPFNGEALQYHNNGNSISEKTTFRNGKKHGKQEKYFKDGTLSFLANYSNGLRNGKVISWWKSGNKRSESNYVIGIANGKQYQWYPNGSKFKTITLVNGKEEGLQQSWRQNGKLYNNYEAKNGRIFGLKRATLCFQLEDEKLQTTIN